MKYMVTVRFGLEAGNRYRDDPSMRRELEALFERIDAEALYVGVTRRDVYMVVDTEDPKVLGDIHTTLSHLAEAAPDCQPVLAGEDFVRISNNLAGEAADRLGGSE